MPSGRRLRSNSVYGTVADNPLAPASVTLTSNQLVLLPAIAGDHAVITLDPIRQFGDPEIVIVTAHTPASTIATIQRGAYSTIAREHPQGTVWVHASLDEDFIEIVTSGTRPTDPYEGQFIYETDTNKLVGHDGVDWAPRDAGGQLAYAQVTADQLLITAETDITGLTVTWNAVSSRVYKITGHVLVNQVTNPGVGVLKITNAANVEAQRIGQGALGLGEARMWEGSQILFGASGSVTRKLRLSSTAASIGSIAAASRPNFILVEDIGAA